MKKLNKRRPRMYQLGGDLGKTNLKHNQRYYTMEERLFMEELEKNRRELTPTTLDSLNLYNQSIALIFNYNPL